MTDRKNPGHSQGEMGLSIAGVPAVPFEGATESRAPTAGRTEELRFEAIWERHFDFVWRSARRLGVRDASLDDVVQDVFLVVHRRLAEFEGRSTVRTWLFGIVLRVVRDHRRTARRKPTEALPEIMPDAQNEGPAESAARREAARVLHAVLDDLDEDKRVAFILSELEQMTAPEISETLGVNLNTVYSRVRAARREFEQAVARHRAKDGWRGR